MLLILAANGRSFRPISALCSGTAALLLSTWTELYLTGGICILRQATINIDTILLYALSGHLREIHKLVSICQSRKDCFIFLYQHVLNSGDLFALLLFHKNSCILNTHSIICSLCHCLTKLVITGSGGNDVFYVI